MGKGSWAQANLLCGTNGIAALAVAMAAGLSTPVSAVIGSKEFVNEVFASARGRFGLKRKDGARKLKGDAASANPALWSLRDLRNGIA